MAGFWNKLSRSLELPPDAMAPVPRITMSGDGEVLVMGKTALLEYTRERIRLETELCPVEITGEKLQISAMDRMGMCIVGDIENIRFGEAHGTERPL